MDLWWLANDKSCLRHQAFWHSWQGPLLEGQQSNNITLIDVLEGVHAYLEGHLDHFEIPEAFVTKELPLNVAARNQRRFGLTITANQLRHIGRPTASILLHCSSQQAVFIRRYSSIS